jgi:hypothetical protein
LNDTKYVINACYDYISAMEFIVTKTEIHIDNYSVGLKNKNEYFYKLYCKREKGTYDYEIEGYLEDNNISLIITSAKNIKTNKIEKIDCDICCIKNTERDVKRMIEFIHELDNE